MAVAGVGGADIKGRIDAILANRIGVRLTLSKRLVLAIAAVVALALPIVTGRHRRGGIRRRAVTGSHTWRAAGRSGEALRCRVHQAVRPIWRRDAAEWDEGDALRLLWSAVAVAGRAGVPCTAGPDRLVGLPEWIDTERYAIAGTIPDGVPVSALPVLMTNLLKDRFRMVSHTETREMPVYNLVLARSDKRLGPSLKETSAECRAAMEARLAAPQRGASPPSAPTVSGACPPPGLNIGFLSQGGIEMAILTQGLTQLVGRPVIDRTGLTGRYDYTLTWMPEPGIGPPGPPVDPEAPSIFTAVQEQLGLKLEALAGRSRSSSSIASRGRRSISAASARQSLAQRTRGVALKGCPPHRRRFRSWPGIETWPLPSATCTSARRRLMLRLGCWTTRRRERLEQ